MKRAITAVQYTAGGPWEGKGGRQLMKIKTYVNKHGLLIKVVQRPVALVVLAANKGEIARWDDHEGYGLIRHSTGPVSRITDRGEWNVAVKVTASMMRGE